MFLLMVFHMTQKKKIFVHYLKNVVRLRRFVFLCISVSFLFIISFQDSGRCRGYCFITFSTPEEAQIALSKDKEHIGKRYIDVALSTANGNSEPKIGGKNAVIPLDCRCVFVKGIPYDTTEEKVKEVLMYELMIDFH